MDTNMANGGHELNEQELNQVAGGVQPANDGCPNCHKSGFVIIDPNYQLYYNDGTPFKKVKLRRCKNCGTEYYLPPYLMSF